MKDHLTHHKHSHLTREYVEKLDATLSYGVPIDLRNDEEKQIVISWKQAHQKPHSDEKKSEE